MGLESRSSALSEGDELELDQKILDLAQTMSDNERTQMKLLLGMAAAGLMRNGLPPVDGIDAVALSATLSSISRLQPHRDRVPPNGIVYRGRPTFLSDEILLALQKESKQLRTAAVRFEDHFVVTDAPLANQVACSSDLRDLLGAHTERFVPTMKADYLYYDQIGLGIDPHVDSESFALNAIMMVEHVYEAAPSALVLYPPRLPMERVFLTPGEFIVMYADSIVHARERMKKNERVSIVAFGFQPTV